MKSNFFWFFKNYLKSYIFQIIFIFFLGILVSVTTVAVIQFVKPMLDDVFINKDLEVLKFISIAIVALYLVSGLTRYLYFTMKKSLGEKATMELRNDLYIHILKLPLHTHTKYHSGELYSRVVNDSQQVTKGIMSFMELIREPLTFLGFLLTALFSSWKLTLIILTVAPIVFYIIATVGKLIKRYTNRSLEQFGLIGIILNESFTGMKIIKAFTIEYLIKLRFLENNKKLYNAMVKIYKIENLSTPFVEFLGSIIAAIVIYIGGVWVINSEITQGQFMTVLIALGLAQQPLKAINSSNISLQTAISGIDRIKEILNLKIEKIHIGEKLKEFNNSIELKNVNFNYIDSESNVLKNINLEIKKGEVIALVGTSGSGKTTLANLIPRFFEPSSGEILIDGVNINRYSLKSLRKKIALVSQDTFLFKDSIKTNMLAGNNKANKEDIKNALNLAYAYDFVETFEDKEETIIGERGTRLSGGEKQRLAIARAIIKNAPILILDEATSSLDTESEIKVQKALDRLMENKTTLVIAHRLSTIKNANKIIVMENGKIVQEGKHSDLINIKGPYKDFYEKQWR